MLECFDQDFVRMTKGFLLIVIFALVSFYLLNYFSRDEYLAQTVTSIFSSLTRQASS